jgi:hypothetical protein
MVIIWHAPFLNPSFLEYFKRFLVFALFVKAQAFGVQQRVIVWSHFQCFFNQFHALINIQSFSIRR